MPSGRNTATATSSGPNGRPPGAGSGAFVDEPRRREPHLHAGARARVPARRRTVPALRSRHAGAYGHLRRLRHRRPHQMDERHLCRRQKLVGILIEHSYSGPTLARTIAGIGINVNQRAFDPALPNPVSMAVASGRTFDRREVLESFHACCMGRYGQLVRGEKAALQEEYRKRMYRLGETHPLPPPRRHARRGRPRRRTPLGRVDPAPRRRHAARIPLPGDRIRDRREKLNCHNH